MKILFIIKKLENASGGAERLCVNISNYIAEHNDDVTLLTFDKEGTKPFYPIHDKINFLRVDLVSTDKDRFSVVKRFRQMRALRSAIKTLNPDRIIGFMHSSYSLLPFALLGTKYEYIASEHTVIRHYNGKFLEYLLMVNGLGFSNKSSICSEANKSQYPWFARRRMQIIKNPVSAPSKKILKKRHNTVLSVGRLIKDKGHTLLIEAIHRLVINHPYDVEGWKLRIVGEGENREFLSALIERLEMSEYIELAGSKQNIYEEYKTAKIYVHPSSYESFGLAVVEAMGCELPVIGFADCSGVNELIKHEENGLLLGQRDKNVLADNLLELIKSEKKRSDYGACGLKNSKLFSSDAVYPEWLKFLSQ